MRAAVRAAAVVLAVALAALGVTACIEDDAVVPPVIPEPGGELFLRYVSLGNSITAGFQSGGIHEQMQAESYPAILAARAGADFGIPELSMPGCPPPLAAPLSAERISTVACAARGLNHPPLVQNLAVPGHTLADALFPPDAGSTVLETMILGGKTQVQAMADAEPTLVSAWLGNNDALGAALSGDTTRLTPLAAFEALVADLAAAIEATPAEDAILIGVANAMTIAPALQPGAYFWLIEASGEAPVPLAVDDDCAPGTPGGSRWVSFLVANEYIAGEADSVRVSCAADADWVLNEAEAATVAARVVAYNAAIEAAAVARGWEYVDPNASFIAPALADPDRVRKCQGLATATTPTELAAAVEATCPGPAAPNFFGSFFSFDGVHPSSEAHAVIADTLALRLNAKHGLALPAGD